jgi:photosystem II stability/assembly factor-like uncharacterized protein
MMKFIVLLVFIFLFEGDIFSQWISKSNPYITENLNDLAVFNSNEVIISGDSSIIVTTNGGNNWTKTPQYKLNEIEFVNYNTGYGLSDNHFMKTTNHGNTWVDLPFPYPNPFSTSYYNLRLKNDGVMLYKTFTYIIFNLSISNQVYFTTNDGANWTAILSSYGSGSAFGIVNDYYNDYNFVNENTGFAQLIHYETTQSYTHSSSKIIKTTNGGLNWVDIWSMDSVIASKMYFINATTGYFSVHGGVQDSNVQRGKGIYKTTNCGVNWMFLTNFYSDNFVYTNEFTAFSSSGYATSDGGISWIQQFSPHVPNGISFINNFTGYIVGNDGVIYKTTNAGGLNVGVQQNSIVIPANFSLSQNYPNPFNPSTVIRYQLSVAGFTTLKVFDLLGKEVATLVNEKQPAGSYAVDFNSAEYNLPSGIYFYTLNAGEYKETKKMVLVK